MNEGAPAPDHATFARFRSIHFAPCANKYTFVWKKAVTKNQAKLLVKIADFVAECEQPYDIKIVYGDTVKMKLPLHEFLFVKATAPHIIPIL